MLKVSYQNATIRHWRTESGELAATFKLTSNLGQTQDTAWSQDGRTFARGTTHGNLEVCDAEAGKQLFVVVGHNLPVFQLAWSIDGTTLASGGSHVWDVAAGRLIRSLHMPSNQEILALSWSPDGSLLASGGTDGSLRLWRGEADELLHVTPVGSQIVGAAWSPDGRIVAIATRTCKCGTPMRGR
jgi:WD40 repeat protein